jgi:hypothetical protein
MKFGVQNWGQNSVPAGRDFRTRKLMKIGTPKSRLGDPG